MLLGVTDQAVKHVLISPDKLNYYRLWRTLISKKIILRFAQGQESNSVQTLESHRISPKKEKGRYGKGNQPDDDVYQL